MPAVGVFASSKNTLPLVERLPSSKAKSSILCTWPSSISSTRLSAPVSPGNLAKFTIGRLNPEFVKLPSITKRNVSCPGRKFVVTFAEDMPVNSAPVDAASILFTFGVSWISTEREISSVWSVRNWNANGISKYVPLPSTMERSFSTDTDIFASCNLAL